MINQKKRFLSVKWLLVGFRYVFYKMVYSKDFFCGSFVIIKGYRNIEQKNSFLKIGLDDTGFIPPKTYTFLNIRGKLLLNGAFSIARGCSFDIGEKGIVELGENSYINANSIAVIMNCLKIGDNCAISWNCQFLDSDFHSISPSNTKSKEQGIIIGNHVWIGCNSKIYKGVYIADGCIIASDSVVKNPIYENNCLIAGNPAKIVKTNVNWC